MVSCFIDSRIFEKRRGDGARGEVRYIDFIFIDVLGILRVFCGGVFGFGVA